jgi:RimJ/RimL family protein N-acetyltransferase
VDELGVANAHPNGARPFARDQYIQKFRTLTEGIITAREANRFLADVQDLASIPAGELHLLNVALPAGHAAGEQAGHLLMMASIAIRDGVEEDAPALARLHLRSRAAAMPWLREVHGEAGIARWIAGTLMGRRRVRVAEAVGVPVGYVGFGQDPRHGPMVMHLYLDPGWRGQGIGTRLLEEAAAELGPRLSLFCFARNAAARRFYEARGFRPVATGDGTDNEEREPDVLYLREPLRPTTTREPAA